MGWAARSGYLHLVDSFTIHPGCVLARIYLDSVRVLSRYFQYHSSGLCPDIVTVSGSVDYVRVFTLCPGVYIVRVVTL